MFYVLRYLEGTPMIERKHVHTLGRWDSFEDADDARRDCPNGAALEVLACG